MAEANQSMSNVTERPGLHSVSRAGAESGKAELNFGELLFYLLKKAKFIVGATFLGAAVAAVLVLFILSPVYKATAKLYVFNSSGGLGSMINLADLQIGSYLTPDYLEAFKTWEVNEQVITNLNLPYDYVDMEQMVTATNPFETRILYITVKSGEAAEAAAIANEYANVVRKYIADVMAMEAPSILSSALQPLVPDSPNRTWGIILGGVLGFVGSIAAFFFRFIFDDKIHSTEDVALYAGMPTLAVIPLIDQKEIADIEGEKRKQRKGQRRSER